MKKLAGDLDLCSEFFKLSILLVYHSWMHYFMDGSLERISRLLVLRLKGKELKR